MNAEQARALPLTKSWVNEHAHLLEYGSDLFAEPIAEWLGVNAESDDFDFAFKDIALQLQLRQPHGIFLNGYGFRKRTGRKGWLIVPVKEMLDESVRRWRADLRGLRRTHLVTQTIPRDQLSNDEKRRHDRILMIQANQLLFAKQPKRFQQKPEPPPKELPESPQA